MKGVPGEPIPAEVLTQYWRRDLPAQAQEKKGPTGSIEASCHGSAGLASHELMPAAPKASTALNFVNQKTQLICSLIGNFFVVLWLSLFRDSA